jgi:hypothetical protein
MKSIKAIGIAEKGKPYRMLYAKAFREQLDNLPPGKYQHTVDKYKRKATPLQFGYLYGLVYPLSMIALNDAGYEFTNVDQVDVFWKLMFANKEVLNRETGEIMRIPLSKSEFLTIDHMVYTAKIREYCSEYLNTTIPDPDPNYKQNKNNNQNGTNRH